MSSFLTEQANKRRGKWTAEEELYAASLAEAFKEGILSDVEDGQSLRGYLAVKLRTNVKRISKKYEGTNYEGKRVYLQRNIENEVPKETGDRESKLTQLKVLELSFERSVKLLQDAEAAKQDMSRLNPYYSGSTASASALVKTAKVNTQDATLTGMLPVQYRANYLPGTAPSTTTGTFLSSKVLEDNMAILAAQTRQAQGAPLGSASQSLAALSSTSLRMANLDGVHIHTASRVSPDTSGQVSSPTASALSLSACTHAFYPPGASRDTFSRPPSVEILTNILRQHQQKQQASLYFAALAQSLSSNSFSSVSTSSSTSMPTDHMTSFSRTSSTQLHVLERMKRPPQFPFPTAPPSFSSNKKTRFH
jgi:hypothetical protein